MAVHSEMEAMHPMERCIGIVEISQEPEGFPSSGDIGLFHGSGNIPQAGIQLEGKGLTEEVDYNIPIQEEEH